MPRTILTVLSLLVLASAGLAAQGVAGDIAAPRPVDQPQPTVVFFSTAQIQIGQLLGDLQIPEVRTVSEDIRGWRRVREWVGDVRYHVGETARTLQEMQDQILLTRGSLALLTEEEASQVKGLLLEIVDYSRRTLPIQLKSATAAIAASLLERVELIAAI